jgi:hypothetical protein
MKSVRAIIAAFCSAIPLGAYADELTCTYLWMGKTKNHPLLIEVTGNSATIRGGLLNLEFRVIENSSSELVIVQTNTRANSGRNYPVGADRSPARRRLASG